MSRLPKAGSWTRQAGVRGGEAGKGDDDTQTSAGLCQANNNCSSQAKVLITKMPE